LLLRQYPTNNAWNAPCRWVHLTDDKDFEVKEQT
jgi:hypothetical protein